MSEAILISEVRCIHSVREPGGSDEVLFLTRARGFALSTDGRFVVAIAMREPSADPRLIPMTNVAYMTQMPTELQAAPSQAGSNTGGDVQPVAAHPVEAAVHVPPVAEAPRKRGWPKGVPRGPKKVVQAAS